MKEIRRLLYVLATAVFFIGLFILCQRFSDTVVEEYSGSISESILGQKLSGNSSATIRDVNTEQEILQMVEADYSIDMKLTVSGEILCQNQQLEYAYDSDDGTFSFASGLQYLKESLSVGEVSVSSLNTSIAGYGNGYDSESYGYCAAEGMYNSPESLLTDLKDAGITMLNTATNHALDSGSDGMVSTISHMKTAGLDNIGTGNASVSSRDYIKKVNYVNIAFSGYTAHTNGQDPEEGSEAVINTLDGYDSSKMKEMCGHISDLKEANDYVIVMIDFGRSDLSTPDENAKECARELADAGADLILGTGARAVQPMEQISCTDENGGHRTCNVFYSLGSIYSSDYYTEYEDLDSDIGLIIHLNLRNAITGTVDLTGMEIVPVYLNWINGLVQPVPVCEAKDTDTYQKVLDDGDIDRINSAYTGTVEHLLQNTSLKASYDRVKHSYYVGF